MAKSLRSKVKRRFRTAKRGVIKRTVAHERAKPVLEALAKASQGIIESKVTPPNAFRSDDDDAVVPQHTFTPLTDFRASVVPEAGYAITGNRRVTHPANIVDAADGALEFRPQDDQGGDGDAEILPEAAPRVPPLEDDEINYDGTPKVSGRSRRRKKGRKGDSTQFAFWGRKSEKRA